MEAKVDVRKLQLLNDRIAQTIEALNQVRLSVYGLSHTPGVPQGLPFVPPTMPIPGYGMTMTPGFPGFFPGIGLQHTPFTPITPFQPFPPYPLQNVPGFVPPFVPPFVGGLQHTGPDVFEQKVLEFRAADPYRIYQTFPYITSQPWPVTAW